MNFNNSNGIASAFLVLLIFFAGYWVRDAGYVIRVNSPSQSGGRR